MPEITQETINRALLGDPEAIEEFCKGNYIFPCKMCGSANVKKIPLGSADKGFHSVFCLKCGFSIDRNGTSYEILKAWNTRPDLRAVAKELYGVKWRDARTDPPEPLEYVLIWYDGPTDYGEGVRRAYLSSDKKRWHRDCHDKYAYEAIRFWQPSPEPPEERA